MREIITLQIGPFANWAGSHFWNVQDDARHPASYDDAGEPVYDEGQADVNILYRSSGRTAGGHLTPRLVLCDAADALGSLNSESGRPTVNGGAAAAMSVNPLANQEKLHSVLPSDRTCPRNKEVLRS